MINIPPDGARLTNQCIFSVRPSGRISVTVAAVTLFSTALITADGLLYQHVTHIMQDPKTNEWEA